MFSNWLTWRSVAAVLDEQLRGARIAAVFTQQKSELVLELDTTAQEMHLQLSAQQNFAWLLPKPEFARARKNSLDLFPDAIGEVIHAVQIAANDRIIRLRLESGKSLYASLIPSRGNFLLYGSDGALLEQFKRGRLPVDPLSLQYENILKLPLSGDVEQLRVETHGQNALEAMKKLRPWMQGTVAKELLHRCGIPISVAVDELTREDIGRLLSALSEIDGELRTGRSHVSMSGGLPDLFSLIRLQHIESTDVRSFDDVIQGLHFFVRSYWSTREFVAARDRILKAASHELEKVERKITALSSEAELKRTAGQWKKYGNLLMIHLFETPGQHDRMIVPDIFIDPRLVVSIPLTPGLSVLENAQRYFGKAQRTVASLEYVETRRVWLNSLRTELQDLIARASSAMKLSELREALDAHGTLLRRLGLTEKGTRDEAPFPFRRFVVAGGFEVWAGRSSANNDELTVRHSRPNDIWFHARGVGGSHVVLKVSSASGEPTKEAIKQAASIAAYYSKHRNAKNVPVAYTEKKYVRKPKGAAPGSVIMEREKVIMVQPMLPEGMSEE